MKLNALAVAAVLVIGAFATGCGSSDDSSDSTTTASLTKAQWIAQADAICKTGNDKTNAAAHQQFQQRPTAQQIEQFTTDTIIPDTQQELDQIKALGFPTEQGSQAEAVLTSAQDSLDKLKADPSLAAANGDPFAETNQMAKAYGLKVCGQ